MERVPRNEDTTLRPPSPFGRLAGWTLLCLVAIAYAVSGLAFDREPLTLAIFRGGDTPQAFRLSMYLNGTEPLVEEVSLTPSQRHELSRSVLTEDAETLRYLARLVGASGRYVASATGADSSVEWPSFLGGGWSSLIRPEEGWFTRLTYPERAVLAMWCKTPPEAPWVNRAVKAVPPIATAKGKTVAPQDQAEGNAPLVERETPSAEATVAVDPQAPLRVEILNGCGMTNAADALARAAKEAGMQVVFVGNAEGPKRFKTLRTTVESRAGVPVSLEVFCKRLGIPLTEVREDVEAKTGVDVTVTVGRDYPRIRERLRVRNQ
jgi:hypothetical protein